VDVEIGIRVDGVGHRPTVDTRTSLLDAPRERPGNANMVPAIREVARG
jgi:xanthine dehydrogenase YagT iron-sulfur-binding subunit